jgi:hypothetical protein
LKQLNFIIENRNNKMAENIPVKMKDFSVLDTEFDSIRDRFDSEMSKMEDEMNKFRSELLDKESSFFSRNTLSSAGVGNNSSR